MTALSERVAAEHFEWLGGACYCGWSKTVGALESCVEAHIAAVTEREVRQQVAGEIEGITIRGGNNRDKHASVIRSKAARVAEGTDR